MASVSVYFLIFSLVMLLAAAAESKKYSYSTMLLLPLKTQRTAGMSPNKLRFHHNITLTVTLAVGSPPQNVSMVLDTGSELSWLLCNSSANNFHPNLSSTYTLIPCSSPTCRSRSLPIPPSCGGGDGGDGTRSCHVSLSYADASSSEGPLASDGFLIGSAPAVKTLFGCVESTSAAPSPDDPVAAGLLGMNRGALSFVSQTGTRRFSYCISDRAESGVLLLGEPGAGFLLPVQLKYTPMVQMSSPLPYFDQVAYSVQLEGIRVGSVLLPLPKSILVPDHTGAGQTMVDSGTQFTFLLGPVYDVLKTEFIKQTRGLLTLLDDPDFVFEGAFDTCFKVDDDDDRVHLENVRLPEVVMVFRGAAEVRVGGGERLLYKAGEGIRCLTFGNSELIGVEAYVIGHHHQVNVWVEYDLQNGRVGFGQVQCDWVSQRLGVGL